MVFRWLENPVRATSLSALLFKKIMRCFLSAEMVGEKGVLVVCF